MTQRAMSHSLLATTAAALAAALLASCGGGGGGGTITVTAVNLNPASPSAGSVVALSASATGTGASAAVKDWTVSTGTLQLTPPDFSLLLRETALGRTASAASLSTSQATVYWVTPGAGGSATITCAIGQSSKSRTVTLGSSPVTLSVTDAAGGKKTCTVAANNVTDLYQAAFRINFTSAWQPESATRGSFLGSAADTLFIGLTSQSGFVPVAITKKGEVAGADGSGTLATITFAPKAASGARQALDLPFELGLVILRNSQDEPIEF